MPNTEPDPELHVGVAVIINPQGEVLISQRPDHVHQGGLWEFPGGKIEASETVQQAIHREIFEELDIHIESMQPLIRIHHRYPDKSVLLDVWRIESFSGEPRGCEGQPIEWLAMGQLSTRTFPAANQPIIKAMQLPREYLITPAPGDSIEIFLAQLEASLEAGIRLVQLRAKALSKDEYQNLAEKVVSICKRNQARILLNADPDIVQQLGADGVHLDSNRLMTCQKRPLPQEYLVAASCHTQNDLEKAEQINADFALLSPVLKTASHPDAEPLGWERFEDIVEHCAMPVYALGGMQRKLLNHAIRNGGQGIAAIRSLWVSDH